MESYLDFISGVLLFRTARDVKCSCSPGTPPELWLDVELENISEDPDWSCEERRLLILTAKIADLLDDRKQWLIDEVGEDIRNLPAVA